MKLRTSAGNPLQGPARLREDGDGFTTGTRRRRRSPRARGRSRLTATSRRPAKRFRGNLSPLASIARRIMFVLFVRHDQFITTERIYPPTHRRPQSVSQSHSKPRSPCLTVYRNRNRAPRSDGRPRNAEEAGHKRATRLQQGWPKSPDLNPL